jgi:preprotein translocase subunit SecE
MGNLINFFRESRDEMTHHVTWSKFSELQNTSVVVLVASLIFAIVVGAMDWVFNTGIEQIYKLF